MAVDLSKAGSCAADLVRIAQDRSLPKKVRSEAQERAQSIQRAMDTGADQASLVSAAFTWMKANGQAAKKTTQGPETDRKHLAHAATGHTTARHPAAVAASLGAKTQTSAKSSPHVSDVMSDPTLATRYSLSTEHLAPFTSEEVLRFARFNLAAIADGRVNNLDNRSVGNIVFAVEVLRERAGEFDEKLDNLTQELMQLEKEEFAENRIDVISRTFPGAELVAKKLAAELNRYEQEHGLLSLDEIDPAVVAGTRSLLAYSGPLTQLEWHLGRLPTIPIDPPDFKQRLPNIPAQIMESMSGFAVPKDETSRAFVERSAKEFVALLGRVASTAQAVDRPDIATSAYQLQGTVAKAIGVPA